MLRILTFITTLVCILPGWAQVSNSVSPAQEMKRLAPFTGSWTGTSSKNGAAAERASATFRVMQGGHWMRGDLVLGRSLEATLLIGWSSSGKAFRAHIFDSSRPTSVVGNGSVSRDALVIESPSEVSDGTRWTLQVVSGKESELKIVRESRSSSGWVQEGVTTLRKPDRSEGGGMTLPRG